MIQLNREAVQIPEIFASGRLLEERRNAEAFYAVPASQRSQRRFDWYSTVKVLDSVKERLLKLSHGKCAYCERLLAGRPTVACLRPKQEAIGLDGKHSPDHYWWLGFEWTNLLPSCAECNVTKRTRFPIKRFRAEPGSFGEALLSEEPLLLDPFHDNPEQHLLFTEAGHVVGRTERGAATIEVLALNRLSLVRDRFAHIQHLHATLAALEPTKGQARMSRLKTTITALKQFLDVESPHLGVTQQFLVVWAEEFALEPLFSGVLDAFGGLLTSLRALLLGDASFKTEIEATQSKFEKRTRQKERHSIDSEAKAAKSAYFSGARRIEHVVLHNFKAIPHLEIDVAPPGNDRESWLMLLGENAVGKSSLLQGIALALMGQKHLERMGLDARQFVCRESDADGGWVRVYLTNLSRPLELRFNRRERHFVLKPPESLVLLLGYGSTRLLPRTLTADKRYGRYVRVRNLFNPYARLSNVERLLTDRIRISDDRFGQAAWAIKQLLLLKDDDNVTRERRHVIIQTSGFRSSLMELSDGYQSVVALAGDILAAVAEKWESIESAEGFVLIDEIETHLHPRWKMEIVRRLRRVFPKLTFIATTHDPLCLCGLEQGEIVVLRRRNAQVEAEAIKESVANLRADQVLTSELFGLFTTRDPQVNAAILRHAKLSSTMDRSPEQEAELRSLRTQLAGKLPTGDTAIDRAVEQTWQHVVEQHVLPEVRRQLTNRTRVENLPEDAKDVLKSLFSAAEKKK